MQKTRRFTDTLDTLDKLPEFLHAIMAINEHTQKDVAKWCAISPFSINRYLNHREGTLRTIQNLLMYCEAHDPKGSSYKVVALMTQK